MSEIKKIKSGEVELTVVLEGENWANDQKKAFKKLVKGLDLKGFRKGQVPESLAKKYINDQAVAYEAASDSAQAALEAAIKEHNVELIDRPEFVPGEINTEKAVLVFKCPVNPDVTLGDYKSLEYKVEPVEVKDEEVEKELKNLQERKADLELKEDGTVEKGDTAVIDFEGFKDGVAFEGGKGENYDLSIGSGSFIPGFEDQLIGMKPEEEKEIEVTFPEDYGQKDLAGKLATFKVKVHEIKTKVLPELGDELVKDLKIENVNTVDEFKSYVKEQLTKQKEYEADTKATNELLDSLANQSTVEVPEVLVNRETDNMLQDYEQRLMQQGITLDQFVKFTGQTLEKLKENFKKDAEKKVKISLVLNEIAKAENIEVSDEEVDKEYDKYAEGYGMDKEEIKKYIPFENIKNDLKIGKALDIVKH